jgi:hypothetical protein
MTTSTTNQGTIMSKHQYTYTPEPKYSKAQEIIITVSCLAVFALWGVLLALGV